MIRLAQFNRKIFSSPIKNFEEDSFILVICLSGSLHFTPEVKLLKLDKVLEFFTTRSVGVASFDPAVKPFMLFFSAITLGVTQILKAINRKLDISKVHCH